MFGRILVPLDGSARAEAALRIAELIPSRIVRLICVEPVRLTAARERWARGEEGPYGASWLVPSAEAYLELLAIPLRERGREVEAIVTSGKAGARIVEAAADADLIVMATRGGGATRFLVGGVADYVARHATAPTLLVRDEHAAVPAIERVVVPLDGSERAEEALVLADVLRRALGARLHLVRVIDPSLSVATAQELARAAEAYLEEQIRRIGAPADASQEVRVGRVGTVCEHLLEVARPGDLFVVASRRRRRLDRALMGSVTTALIRQAPVPVVLVPAMPGGMAAALTGAAEGGRIAPER